MPRFLSSQLASAIFCGTACTLTALHPVIHHLEGGTLDAILDYLYAASLDAMNRNTN